MEGRRMKGSGERMALEVMGRWERRSKSRSEEEE